MSDDINKYNTNEGINWDVLQELVDEFIQERFA
jgi:hypothetical protein